MEHIGVVAKKIDFYNKYILSGKYIMKLSQKKLFIVFVVVVGIILIILTLVYLTRVNKKAVNKLEYITPFFISNADFHDIKNNVVIIGSGPAGYTAALYLARANLLPLMLEGDSSGDIISGGVENYLVENYPGFPNGINRHDLIELFKKQSKKFGTRIVSENALEIKKNDENLFEIKTSKKIYKTKSIIIATGSTPNRLYIPGYDKFWNNGVSTCALCDGYLYRNDIVAVIGGGDEACQDALYLSNIAKQVYLINRRDKLRASKIMIDRVLQNTKIKIVLNSNVIEIIGKDNVEEIILKTKEDEITKLDVNGVFVAIGYKPNSKFVSSLIETDKNGYIVTNRKYETNVEGIWAVGDVQDPYYRKIITAAGSGSVAALEVEQWLG